jgi:hypothetical protein
MLFFLYFVSLLRHQITNEILLQDPQLERGTVEHNHSGMKEEAVSILVIR